MSPQRRGGRQAGQMLPLFALLAVVLFAFAALALDGGLAFADRRADQNTSDNAALAGVMELTGTITNGSVTNAFAQAQTYIQNNISGSPAPSCSAAVIAVSTAPGSSHQSCTFGSDYTAVLYTPPTAAACGAYNPISCDTVHMMEARITHNNTPNFMRAAGLGNVITIGTVSVARSTIGIPRNTHAVWSTENCGGSNGCGNSMTVDHSTGWAQVDDGQNGADCDAGTVDVLSNEKIHDPTGNKAPQFNVNGLIHRSKNDQDATIQRWWNGGNAATNASADPSPGYAAPSGTNSTYTTLYGNSVNPTPSQSGGTLTLFPGAYTSDVTIGGTTKTDVKVGPTTYHNVTDVVLKNGVYLFNSANLVIDEDASAGAAEVHSWDYSLTGTPAKWTATLPGTASGVGNDNVTDGVEIYLAGSSTMWVKGGMVNLQAPAHVNDSLAGPQGVSNFVGVYVDGSNSGDLTGKNGPVTNAFSWDGGVTDPVAIGSDTSPAYNGEGTAYFHLQGIIYADFSGAKKSLGVFVAPSTLDYTRYAVQGQVVAPYIGMTDGNVPGSQSENHCYVDTGSSGAGKLVQYDARFIPNETFGHGSQLYQ